MQWYAVIHSLMQCTSKDEWLSAAQESTTSANANGYSAPVLQTYCDTRINFGIRFNPSVASSCTRRSSSLDANLGPCSPMPPVVSLDTLNAGVRGLDRMMVPIDAVRVRICLYGLDGQRTPLRGTLESVGALSLPLARQIEDETNALHQVNHSAVGVSVTGPSCPGPVYVTFANRFQHITVTVNGCDVATNGSFVADVTDALLNDLYRYTADIPEAAVSSLVPKGPTGPTG